MHYITEFANNSHVRPS